MNQTLDAIALKYDTDKSSRAHNYTKYYDSHFKDIRTAPLKIFEIGIQNGFSLKTWKEYFPNAHIYGLDIVDLKKFEEDRITVLTGSQSDAKLLEKISAEHGPFDIIIDDGSHVSSDIRASFFTLFPLLKSGGLYIVEDLHTNYWEKIPKFKDWFVGRFTKTFVDDIKKLVDKVNASGKAGYSNRAFDDGKVHKPLDTMDWWDKNVESLNIYRSITFIKKV